MSKKHGSQLKELPLVKVGVVLANNKNNNNKKEYWFIT